MNDNGRKLGWQKLTSLEQLKAIEEESRQNPVLIFKHSTRCSTSAMVLSRLERNWVPEEMQEIKAYYLDLLSFREISNRIADVFQVEHESPQVIVISNGQPVYNQSHLGINYHELRAIITA
jgi:bacillithiol system protein YtxJ